MRGKLDYYYPETIRGTIEALTNVFSDIIVYKHDNMNNKIKLIEVPLQFGSNVPETRINDNGDVEQYIPQLPRIELKWLGLSISEDRIIAPYTDRFWNDEEVHFLDPDIEPGEYLTAINGLFKDKNPIPYNYSFNVKIITEDLNYLSQILENTLPYFTPKNKGIIRVKEFSFLNVERDLVINMEGVSVTMPEDIDFETVPVITAEFDITIEGFIYQRVEASRIVNTIIVDIFTDDILDKEIIVKSI